MRRLAILFAWCLLWAGPQLVLYSSRGGPEGRFAIPFAIAVSALLVVPLFLLRRYGPPKYGRVAVLGMAIVIVTFSLRGASRSFCYATKFWAEAAALDDLMKEAASMAPRHSTIGIVADPESDYEAAISLVEHLQFHGVMSTPISLLPWLEGSARAGYGPLASALLQRPMFRDRVVGTEFLHEPNGLAILVRTETAVARFESAGWKVRRFERPYVEPMASAVFGRIVPSFYWAKASWHLAEKSGNGTAALDQRPPNHRLARQFDSGLSHGEPA